MRRDRGEGHEDDERPGHVPRWLPFADLGLSREDVAGAPPGRRRRAVPSAAGRRRWPALVAAAALLSGGAVVRVPGDVVWPKQVVDVSRLVVVSVRGETAPRGPTGAFLAVRRHRRPTVLQWLIAALPGGRAAEPGSPSSVDRLEPVEAALLTGAGIAPGRGDARALGLSATVRDGQVPRADPSVLLHVVDAVSPADLAAGRRVLVLGRLGTGFTLGCADGALTTYETADPRPDLVLVGRSCPQGRPLREGGATVIEVAGLFDAIDELASR